MKPTLVIVEGQFIGESFSVAEDILSVGRDSDCDVSIPDESLEGTHCRIFRCEDAYLIKDAGSQLGTLVNQNMVDVARLDHGDVIQIGNVTLRFEQQISPQVVDHTEVIFEDNVVSMGDQTPPIDLQIEREAQLTPARVQALQRDVTYLYRATKTGNSPRSTADVFQEFLELTADWLDLRQAIVFLENDDAQQSSPQVFQRPRLNNDTACNNESSNNTSSNSESCPARYSNRLLQRVLSEQAVIQSEFEISCEAESSTETVFATCMPITNNNDVSLGAIYLDTYSCDQPTPIPTDRLKILHTVLTSVTNAINLRELTRINSTRDRFAAVGEVTSGISHRVNNILQVINGGSYLVDYGLKSDDAALVDKGWNIVKRNQSRISRLTTNLLAFSRKFEPSLSRVHLPKVIGEAIESLAETYDVERIHVRHHDAENLTALIDDFYTSKIVENLLSLALSASMADGKELPVSLTTSVDAEHSTLAFSFRHLDDRFNLLSMISRPANKLKAEMGMLELLVSKSHVEGQNGEFQVYTEPERLNTIEVKFPRQTANPDHASMTASSMK